MRKEYLPPQQNDALLAEIASLKHIVDQLTKKLKLSEIDNLSLANQNRSLQIQITSLREV